MGCWITRHTVHTTIHDINDVIQVLHTNIQAAEQTQAALRIKARTYVRQNNRTRAMFYLKQAKQYERQIMTLQGRVLTCTQKIMTLRNMHMASMQLRAIRTATRVFKDFTRQHDLDRVERLQDELEDGMQHVLEVSNVLENSMGDMDIDEDELEEELNALEMVDIPVAPSDTPQPITTPPPTQACRHRSDLPLPMLSQ